MKDQLSADSPRLRRMSALPLNVLQNSFCIVDLKIFEPWTRFSYNDVGAQLISRLTHQWLP